MPRSIRTCEVATWAARAARGARPTAPALPAPFLTSKFPVGSSRGRADFDAARQPARAPPCPSTSGNLCVQATFTGARVTPSWARKSRVASTRLEWSLEGGRSLAPRVGERIGPPQPSSTAEQRPIRAPDRCQSPCSSRKSDRGNGNPCPIRALNKGRKPCIQDRSGPTPASPSWARRGVIRFAPTCAAPKGARIPFVRGRARPSWARE